MGVDKLFEVTRDKDQDLLIKVLVALQAREALPSGALLTGIAKFTSQLEDLRYPPHRAVHLGCMNQS